VRVIVAGAGALGACVAVALARAGLAVTLADPAGPGHNASGVAAGMLAPAFESLFDDRPEHFALLMEARDLWPAFADSLGVAIERVGAVAVSADAARIEAWRDRLSALGVESRLVSGPDLEREGLAPGLHGVAHAEDWRLDPRQALDALRAEASRLGVETRLAAVVGFAPGRADLSDGTAVPADALVIASGASRSLLGVAPDLSVLTPIKGHILTLAIETPPRRVVRFEGGYLCPATNGVLLGATMEVGREDTAIDEARVQGLLAPARGRARIDAGWLAARGPRQGRRRLAGGRRPAQRLAARAVGGAVDCRADHPAGGANRIGILTEPPSTAWPFSVRGDIRK
jgi:glycine oxidase